MSPNDLAFPSQMPLGCRDAHGCPYGLSKRELFAAMAMQGLLSNLAEIRQLGFKDREIEIFAVMRAEGLLAELAKRSDG